jgi:hypothetical protein
MIKLFKKSKIFIFLIILINTSSLIASQIPNNMSITTSSDVDFQQDDMFRNLFNKDGTFSYDAVLLFLDKLENEQLDVKSEEDWNKINQFLAFLARQGIMPDTSYEEKLAIERDIQEDLSSNEIIFQDVSCDINNYQILPAIYYEQRNILKDYFIR